MRSLHLKGCGLDEEAPCEAASGAVGPFEGENSFVSTDSSGWTWVTVDGVTMRFRSFRSSGSARASDSDGGLVAPMPGSVVAVHVEIGGAVGEGDPILTIEAMKMEQTLASPIKGIVEAVNVVPGELIDAGVEVARVGKSD